MGAAQSTIRQRYDEIRRRLMKLAQGSEICPEISAHTWRQELPFLIEVGTPCVLVLACLIGACRGWEEMGGGHHPVHAISMVVVAA